MTAGKIENLRIASQKLNGLEVKANEVFSFWKHIGNPNFGQGYVIGREIREGCVVPTIAGGLCQLSNALYDAALKANFDIIERHKHTKVIKGSLAEKDRDATVKWNYIDLRFKSSFDFRIDIELTSDKLIVSFKSKQKNIKNTDTGFALRNTHKLNDCYSWKALNPKKTYSTTFQGIYRAIKLRLANKKKNNIFELILELDKKIAKKAAQNIPLASTHLVISQNLLPFIYETGVLGGRTFDVLMTRLPFEKLHERLDFAFSKHTESPTLKDFRVPKELIELENKALTKAQKIITTHSEIAEIFKNKVEKLSWQLPILPAIQRKGNKVLFPASAVGRKGAYEIKKLTKELNLNLVVSGRAIEKEGFWEDIKTDSFDGNYDQISLIVYPTYIEHQPRQILKAISMGIPVITTTACGLDSSDKVKVFSLNDIDIIENEIKRILATS